MKTEEPEGLLPLDRPHFTSASAAPWRLLHLLRHRAMLPLLGISLAAAAARCGPLDHWQTRDAQAKGAVSDVTYGDGRFVAYDRTSALLTSRDGRTWSREQTSLESSGNEWRLAAGNGLLLACWPVGGFLLGSTNGTDWSNRYHPNLGATEIVSVTFLNGTFYALGTFAPEICIPELDCSPTPVLYRSTDGLNWTRDVLPTPEVLPGFPPTRVLATGSVAAGNGALVVLGWVNEQNFALSRRLKAWRSTDGRSWTTVDLSAFGRRLGNFPTVTVTFGDDVFVAVAGGPGVIISTDGQSWFQPDVQADASLLDVTFGGGDFVAAGQSGTILSSRGGVTWTKHPSGTEATLRRVVYGNGSFVALGGENTVIQSDPELRLSLRLAGVPQVTLSGPGGIRCQLQRSERLGPGESWETLTSVTLPFGPLTVPDVGGLETGSRFYRAALEW